MIEIKPNIQHQSNCPHCRASLKPVNILWHGMHVCVSSKCVACNTEIIDDLKVGHAVTLPYQVDLAKELAFGNESAMDWLGKPFLKSLQNAQLETFQISKEVFKQCKRVIILNCIDCLYGHCLLKLLNAQRYLEHHCDYGLVVIVTKALRWMVPEGVAEVWTVDIPLKKGQYYYPRFDKFVFEESKRFDKICVSQAHSHPSQFDITKFTRVSKHRFDREEIKIAFIWREDRVWSNTLLSRVLRKANIMEVALLIQNWKIQRLFESIRAKFPSARFAITGLGKKTKFPVWIKDLRVNRFEEKTERKLCHLYSESRLVIGIHGSNMLLPSGHAGMTIDLMPKDRWGNFGQDILYQETDSKLASFRYRYLPIQTKIAEIAQIASTMISTYYDFKVSMTNDKPS